MGDLVKMTDSPRARWAVIDEKKKLFLSRRQTRDEAESFFAAYIAGHNPAAWLVQESDVTDYQDATDLKLGSL